MEHGPGSETQQRGSPNEGNRTLLTRGDHNFELEAMKKQIEWSADEYDKLLKFIQKTHKTLVDLQYENDEFFDEDHE